MPASGISLFAKDCFRSLLYDTPPLKSTGNPEAAVFVPAAEKKNLPQIDMRQPGFAGFIPFSVECLSVETVNALADLVDPENNHSPGAARQVGQTP